MRTLSAAELLMVWEGGAGQTLPQRAMGLLVAASPEAAPESLTRLTIGQRDERLLILRAWMFGPRLAGTTTCPACREIAELDFDSEVILPSTAPVALQDFLVNIEDYNIRFRLPTCADLLEFNEGVADDAVRRRLISNCLLAAQHGGQEVATGQIPGHVVAAVLERMAEVDIESHAQISVACPSCRHTWQNAFDIVSFFWSEINAWARRILREVHCLAAAYGWAEADILAMSAWRRQAYLEMNGT